MDKHQLNVSAFSILLKQYIFKFIYLFSIFYLFHFERSVVANEAYYFLIFFE